MTGIFAFVMFLGHFSPMAVAFIFAQAPLPGEGLLFCIDNHVLNLNPAKYLEVSCLQKMTRNIGETYPSWKEIEKVYLSPKQENVKKNMKRDSKNG